MDQDHLRQLTSPKDIKHELVKQFTKHIEEEEADGHDDGMVKVKLVVVGPSGSGKTCWVSRLIQDKFNQAEQPTVGAKYSSQDVALEDLVYSFEIWDVSGESWCKSLVPMYLQFAQAAIVCYDPMDPSSFDQAKEWVEYVKTTGERDLLISLVGMKADLIDGGELSVQEGDAEQFFVSDQKLEQSFFFPKVSAKTGDNVAEVLLTIAETLHERGVQPPRGSVLDVERTYGVMMSRAMQNENVIHASGQPGQESFYTKYVDPNKVDKLKTNIGTCASGMKKIFGNCFTSSKETAKTTFSVARTNAKEFSKTLNRKSKRVGTNVKSGAAKLVRKVQGGKEGEALPADAKLAEGEEEEDVPAIAKLKG